MCVSMTPRSMAVKIRGCIAAAMALAALVAVSPARATQILNFSYIVPGYPGGWSAVGSLSGTLSGDGNTFVPTAFLSLTFNGNPYAVDPGVLYQSILAPISAPVVTLDGSAESFGTNNTGVFFWTPQYGGQYAGASFFGAGNSGGWVQADWHASIDAPEPASIALFGVGAGVLGMLRRRRR